MPGWMLEEGAEPSCSVKKAWDRCSYAKSLELALSGQITPASAQ